MRSYKKKGRDEGSYPVMCWAELESLTAPMIATTTLKEASVDERELLGPMLKYRLLRRRGKRHRWCFCAVEQCDQGAPREKILSSLLYEESPELEVIQERKFIILPFVIESASRERRSKDSPFYS